jgi:CheY-like chemotaxis protein
VRRYLLELGVETLGHARGEGAIALAHKAEPDLIIMDLYLPDGSGWDLLADLRADPQTRRIPVLILSVMADALSYEGLPDPTEQRVFPLLKPVSRQQLGQALTKVFDPISQDLQPIANLLAAPGTHKEEEIAPLVLVVEDNETNIRTLTDYLTAKAYRVDVARNGSEAMHCVRITPPDIILMDIQMPGMDGLEVTRLLRADARLKAIPVVALTALAMPGDREKALNAGADEYVSKPVSLKQLVGLIETHLQHINEQGEG